MQIFNKYSRSIVFILTLIIFAIWSFPGTIALRYLCFAGVLVILIIEKVNIKEFAKFAWPVWLFLAYIIAHGLFIAPDWHLFLKVYWSDWLKYVLLIFMGAGVGAIFFGKTPRSILLCLGVATAIPSLLHVIMFFAEYLKTGVLPWGYAGINEVHGYFAMLSLQAIVFLCVFMLYQVKHQYEIYLASSVIVVCILSNFFANSRGGVLFILFSFLVLLLIYIILNFANKKIVQRIILSGVICFVLFVGVYKIMGNLGGKDWSASSNFDKIKISLIGDPIRVNCQGTSYLTSEVKANDININPSIENAIYSVAAGDGSRVMTARAGIELLKSYRLGVDGSRNAYIIAINKVCDPIIKMSHTHNAWLDTSLAIGIPGSLILLLIFINFIALAIKNLKSEIINQKAFSFCLLALSIIWIFRGLLDATLITHTLEMQAFPLALLASLILKFNIVKENEKQ